MKKYVLDTNVLLKDARIIHDCLSKGQVIIPCAVPEELDKLSKSDVLGFRSRQAMRVLDELLLDKSHNIIFETKDVYSMPKDWDSFKRDNKIVMCAKEHNAILISDDLNVRIKGDSMGLEVQGSNTDIKLLTTDYDGYTYVTLDHQEQADFYSGTYEIDVDLYLNQYLIIKDKDTDKVIDKFKMTSTGIDTINYKQISSRAIEKAKPRNLEQELAFDMLQDKTSKLKVLVGKQGSGKDFLMATHAFNLLDTCTYDKIIWLRNNVEVKNSQSIGFLPGTQDEKLVAGAMILADILGGKEVLWMLIKSGKLELENFANVRGRNLSKCIVIVTEAQNMTKEHMRLLIARIGEDAILMVNGDYKQVDDKVFENNNGLLNIIEKLKGNKLFGYVKLQEVERSEVAKLSYLLD